MLYFLVLIVEKKKLSLTLVNLACALLVEINIISKGETSIFTKLFRCKHRHVVFTIAEELRPFFRQDRRRFQYLFDASAITIKYWVKEKYKKYDITPAFISILHTFGRSFALILIFI